MGRTDAAAAADLNEAAYRQAVAAGAPPPVLAFLRSLVIWYRMQEAGATLRGVGRA